MIQDNFQDNQNSEDETPKSTSVEPSSSGPSVEQKRQIGIWLMKAWGYRIFRKRLTTTLELS